MFLLPGVVVWDSSWALLWAGEALPAFEDINHLICTEFATVYPSTHPVFPKDPPSIHTPHKSVPLRQVVVCAGERRVV